MFLYNIFKDSKKRKDLPYSEKHKVFNYLEGAAMLNLIWFMIEELFLDFNQMVEQSQY